MTHEGKSKKIFRTLSIQSNLLRYLKSYAQPFDLLSNYCRNYCMHRPLYHVQGLHPSSGWNGRTSINRSAAWYHKEHWMCKKTYVLLSPGSNWMWKFFPVQKFALTLQEWWKNYTEPHGIRRDCGWKEVVIFTADDQACDRLSPGSLINEEPSKNPFN